MVSRSAHGGEAAFGYLLIAFLLFLVALVCGVVVAVLGTAREERFGALPWVALLLNAIPLLYIIVTWR